MVRIDPHVHFRDEEQKYKETIIHGLELAKEQGVDIVFDMPNTFKPILCEADVLRRISLVPEQEKSRYFLYIGATADEHQLKEAVRTAAARKEVIGLKLYAGKSTGNLAVVEEVLQRKIYSLLAQENYQGVLAVHCEKESYMSSAFDPSIPISHCLSRPKIAEIESVKEQIKMVKETGFLGTLYVCHISVPEAVELVWQAKKEGVNIVCGVTPHHLLWDDSIMNLSGGLLYKMNPPLRSREDMLTMRKLLKQRKIDWIETDHAPHTVGEKLHGPYPSGYPSLYLYRNLVEKILPEWGLTEKEIGQLTYGNIVKVFGQKIVQNKN